MWMGFEPMAILAISLRVQVISTSKCLSSAFFLYLLLPTQLVFTRTHIGIMNLRNCNTSRLSSVTISFVISVYNAASVHVRFQLRTYSRTLMWAAPDSQSQRFVSLIQIDLPAILDSSVVLNFKKSSWRCKIMLMKSMHWKFWTMLRMG